MAGLNLIHASEKGPHQSIGEFGGRFHKLLKKMATTFKIQMHGYQRSTST